MHPLRKYLTDIGESSRHFAARVGTSRQTIYRIAKGAQSPKPSLAKRIVEATGGGVTMDDLYKPSMGEKSGNILDIGPIIDGASLDADRLKTAFAVVCNHLTPLEKTAPGDYALSIAAEATVNTFTALAPVTTRQRQGRLRQALRPVLEEILREFVGPLPASALDRGADLATELYFQTWKNEQAAGR